jgi:hypothetical protein
LQKLINDVSTAVQMVTSNFHSFHSPIPIHREETASTSKVQSKPIWIAAVLAFMHLFVAARPLRLEPPDGKNQKLQRLHASEANTGPKGKALRTN